jgi:hypothetical protein
LDMRYVTIGDGGTAGKIRKDEQWVEELAVARQAIQQGSEQ